MTYTDGTQTGILEVEQLGVEPVNAAQRTGSTFSVFSLWFGANVEFGSLVTGVLATAAFGLSFWQAALAIVIGNIFGAAGLSALSIFGPKLGMPELIQSRRAFGYFGNFLPAICNIVMGVSWFAVNTVLGVFALEELVGFSFGLCLVIMVVLQVGVAVIGHHFIHTMERWLVWVNTLVFLAISFYGFTAGHMATPFNPKVAEAVGGFSGAFILTVSVSFSFTLGWIPYASDYTRYLPTGTSAKRVFNSVFWSLFISCAWTQCLGAAFGTVMSLSQPAQLLSGILPKALGIVVMIAVVLGTGTANVINIYSAALSTLVINIPMKRWLAAILVGVCGGLVSWFAGQHNYWQNYENFLFLLGYWVAPWTSIILVDLFLVRRRDAMQVDEFYSRQPAIGRGLVAWIVAILCSIPFINQTIFVGPFAAAHPGFGDITYYVSFLIAGGLYFVLNRWPARSMVPATANQL
jgi:NCS1 family nucleobase:cation symporter-1